MAFIDGLRVAREIQPAPLTALLAIRLAESAMKEGRMDSATRYINIAYAIFDANLEDVSVSHRNSD